MNAADYVAHAKEEEELMEILLAITTLNHEESPAEDKTLLKKHTK